MSAEREKPSERLRRLAQDNPALHDAFIALEPSNKWGDKAGAIWVFEKMLVGANEYPGSVWDIH